jgi:transposase
VGIGRQQGLGPAKAVSPPASELTNYLCRDPIDFRAGINALSVLVEAILKFDPFSRNLYGFVNKRRNQIKVLYWQRSGFCLWQKRLEEERFQWPFHLEGPVITLTEEQFAWLLEGLDLKQLRPHLGHYDRVRTSPLSSTMAAFSSTRPNHTFRNSVLSKPAIRRHHCFLPQSPQRLFRTLVQQTFHKQGGSIVPWRRFAGLRTSCFARRSNSL